MHVHDYSQISAEPYNSNPLLRGYCGVYQFLLWEKEVSSENIFSVKQEGAYLCCCFFVSHSTREIHFIVKHYCVLNLASMTSLTKHSKIVHKK